MAKDPAFLFYSSDFYTGTAFMSDEQVGKYIRLLCMQHQHGHLDLSAMQRLCGGNADACILEKFSLDSNGKYFNQRLDIEVDKRKTHSEKQKQNAYMRWHKSGNAVAMPLEDENEIKDIKRESAERGIADSTVIVNLWNGFAAANGLSMVKEISKGRLAKLKTRNFSPEAFNDILKHIKCSDFCLGKKTDWKASFDWVIENDTNYLKILEGKYEKTTTAPPAPTGIRAGMSGAEMLKYL